MNAAHRGAIMRDGNVVVKATNADTESSPCRSLERCLSRLPTVIRLPMVLPFADA
jgi:hypothetical protein